MLLSLPGSLFCTTVTRSAWEQHLAGRSGRGPHADAVAPDRNAGFSRCDPGRIYRRDMDPIYGYQAINVEAQSNNASSLLSWDTPDDRGAQAHHALARRFHRTRRLESSVLSYKRCWLRRTNATTWCCGEQSVPLSAAGRTGPVRAPGCTPIELTVASAFRDRRADVPAHAARARLLLVPDSGTR